MEDSPEDVELTQRALTAGGIPVNLHTVDDGIRALAYLRREDPYREAVRPDIILLDLNLPRKDGREVLRDIKGDPALKTIPVLILTTSGDSADVLETYRLGCNCYLTKPMGHADHKRLAMVLKEFWLKVATLPPR